MRGIKTRDLWKVMHERNLAQGTVCKPVAPSVAKVSAPPPDPCDDCRFRRADTCGGVPLSRTSKAERKGCVTRFW